MKRSPAASISDALLYEGYLLYPYRESALKNQYRWTFGCLFPKAWCREHGPSERDHLHSEFLMSVTSRTEFDVRLRCLVLPSACQDNGEAQPVERHVALAAVRLADFRSSDSTRVQRTESFRLSAESDVPSDGQARIQGQIRIDCREVGSDAFRVSIEVRNVTDPIASDAETCDVKTRAGAARLALLSTQLSLSCRDAEFISLVDPPAELQAAAGECRNDGCWPVLTGTPGTRDQLLISPIILDDYPQVAPESRGELFDGTEIDEMLTMRIRTLTDHEKSEMENSDPRASDLLRRTEAMANDELSQMHGVMRPSSATPSPREEDISPVEPWCETRRRPVSLCVDGVELRPGDQVVLHPKGRNDIFDLALQGQTATIETIERDFEDQLYFTVTANCDPGRDFGQQGLPGHRFYFRPDEVEPIVLGKTKPEVR